MTRMLHVFVILSLLALGSGEEGARLLASKSLLNRYAVEGRDLTLQYSIYNVGSRSDIWTAAVNQITVQMNTHRKPNDTELFYSVVC